MHSKDQRQKGGIYRNVGTPRYLIERRRNVEMRHDRIQSNHHALPWIYRGPRKSERMHARAIIEGNAKAKMLPEG